MTLHIELTPEQEAWLTAKARREGLALAELARRLLNNQLPELPAANGDDYGRKDPARLAQVRAIRGKYAHVGATSEDLHEERRAERKREEQ
jgi:hypothetical protein